MSGFALQNLPAGPFIDEMPQLVGSSSLGGNASSLPINGLLDLRRSRSLLIHARYSDTSSTLGDLATLAQVKLLWGDADESPATPQAYSAEDVLNVHNTYGIPVLPGVWVGQMMRVPVRRENASAQWVTSGAAPNVTLDIYGSGVPCDGPQFWPGPTSPQPLSLYTDDVISSGALGPFVTIGPGQNGGTRTLTATITQTGGTFFGSITPILTATLYSVATLSTGPAIVPVGVINLTGPAGVTPTLNVPILVGTAQISLPPGPFWISNTWNVATTSARVYAGNVSIS